MKLYENRDRVLIFFSISGHTHSIWKFTGQGQNQNHNCDLRHNCSNARSLTHCTRWQGLNLCHHRDNARSLTHCTTTGIPTGFNFFFFFGHPMEYGPGPGISSEQGISSKPQLPQRGILLTHCARSGIEPASWPSETPLIPQRELPSFNFYPQPLAPAMSVFFFNNYCAHLIIFKTAYLLKVEEALEIL